MAGDYSVLEGLHDVDCPYCNKKAELRSSTVVYKTDHGPIYICFDCSAWVGCHKKTVKPLGRLANKELRQWKINAHSAFDPTWKHNGMSRNDAYLWLAEKLGMERRCCHIGMFDVDTCKKVVKLCHEANGRKCQIL